MRVRTDRRFGDVLGTLFLSVLAGHWRYAHIAALRADAVSAGLLGMDGIVSEDTVRRALKALDEDAGVGWLQSHLDASVLPLLAAPWVLDTVAAPEARAVHYLFKLRLTKNVKRYIERSFASGQWRDAGQGWQAQEGMIQLMGWSRARRIVILRRPLQGRRAASR